LGLDPLDVADEGKLLAFCPPARADALLQAMRAHPLGRDAAVVGEVAAGPAGLVELATAFGGRRVVDWLAGEPCPASADRAAIRARALRRVVPSAVRG
jgi:hydrogenase expression/formation protein HypE